MQENHQLGDTIPGAGSLRKIRWRTKGKGKRGGVRVIYYFASEKGYICLLSIYEKSKKTDLEKDRLKKLTEQVQKWLK